MTEDSQSFASDDEAKVWLLRELKQSPEVQRALLEMTFGKEFVRRLQNQDKD